MAYPTNLKYTKEHEWIRLEGGTGAVGITDFAQQQLGDVVYVELPDVGRQLAAGESFGSIESVKAVSELFAPASGTVAEVNAALAGNPERVNKDPYGEGWMIRIAMADAKEAEALMTAAQYRKYVEDEAN